MTNNRTETYLIPMGDRLLVRPQEADDKTEAGIIIPETAQEQSLRGEVLAKGHGKRTDNGEYLKIPCEIGETIIFSKYAGTEIKAAGETLLILPFVDVIAIVKEMIHQI